MGFEHTSTFFESGASGCDVIDEPEVLIDDSSFLPRSDGKGLLEIGQAFFAGISLHLRSSVTDADEKL